MNFDQKVTVATERYFLFNVNLPETATCRIIGYQLFKKFSWFGYTFFLEKNAKHVKVNFELNGKIKCVTCAALIDKDKGSKLSCAYFALNGILAVIRSDLSIFSYLKITFFL